jgi:hypothetical protein
VRAAVDDLQAGATGWNASRRVCQPHTLIPVLVRAVAGVVGVVRVENRLGSDLDDASPLPHALSRLLP